MGRVPQGRRYLARSGRLSSRETNQTPRSDYGGRLYPTQIRRQGLSGLARLAPSGLYRSRHPHGLYYQNWKNRSKNGRESIPSSTASYPACRFTRKPAVNPSPAISTSSVSRCNNVAVSPRTTISSLPCLNSILQKFSYKENGRSASLPNARFCQSLLELYRSITASRTDCSDRCTSASCQPFYHSHTDRHCNPVLLRDR